MANQKIKVQKSKNGFKISKSPHQKQHEEREKRIYERKVSKNTNPTNKELFEYLNDTNDRLSEIYDMIKSLSTK